MHPKSKVRRPPGAGHLYVRRDKAGRESWFAKWYADGHQVKRKIGPKRDQDGRGLDRAEAERKLRDLVHDVAPPVHSRVEIEEAGRHLIDHRRALGRKPATVEAYDSLLRIHLAPLFAGRSLDAITTEDVEAFIRAKGREGKSAKTITNALGLLHSICVFGQRRGWAKWNPCQFVEKPRAEGDADIRFLDAEELEAAIRAELEAGDELAPTLALMYRAAAMTGLRQGELIGLRWRDVDWAAAKVRVRRSYVRGEFSSPKSRRGTRSVPLADELAAALDRHHQASGHQGDGDLVFAHPSLGKPLDRTKVRKRFKAAVTRAGVGQFEEIVGEDGKIERRALARFHDLRHTFGTRMAGVGVPMRTLQEWLGHRDFKTTLIYADYSPSELERGWVEEAFARSTPGTKPPSTERTEQH
jgi:integrase